MLAEAVSPSLVLQTSPRLRHVTKEPIDRIDLKRIENAVREILLAIGEDPDRDGLIETPKRVAKSYRELFRGLSENPSMHLSRTFSHEHNGIVILRDIEFSSVCEHHLLPFFGKAHIAYLPSGGLVVGLSKLARTVDLFARRPQVQERMTDQIADALVEHLNPEGVAVVIEAQHMCMKLRGVNKACSTMQTFGLRGLFRSDQAKGMHVVSLLCRNTRDSFCSTQL